MSHDIAMNGRFEFDALWLSVQMRTERPVKFLHKISSALLRTSTISARTDTYLPKGREAMTDVKLKNTNLPLLTVLLSVT